MLVIATQKVNDLHFRMINVISTLFIIRYIELGFVVVVVCLVEL